MYDAAIVMVKYLKKNYEMTDMNVVELGTGCGFSSIYVSKQADTPNLVLATDLDSVLTLTERNISKNCKNSDKIQAMPLFWGNQAHLNAVQQVLSDHPAKGLIVFGADILFDFENYEGLCETFD